MSLRATFALMIQNACSTPTLNLFFASRWFAEIHAVGHTRKNLLDKRCSICTIQSVWLALLWVYAQCCAVIAQSGALAKLLCKVDL